GAATSNGFSKLGAYGQVNGVYRWLLDFTGDGVPDFAVPSGFQVNGLPVAGKFNPPLPGDRIGLFDGQGTWYLDTNGDNNIAPGDTIVQDNLTGFPIVGDFDGDGRVDLATYRSDTATFYFDLAINGYGGTDATIRFGTPGAMARPVAADMNRDGVTDVGIFVPNTTNTSADYFFLVSTGAPVPGTVNTLNHPFSPPPFGSDLHFTFGAPC